MSSSALGTLTFDELLERLAAPAPAPAGGSAAALSAAMAASLIVMIGRGTPGWPEGRTVADRATGLRSRLVALAHEDARAVGRLLETFRERETTARAGKFANALVEASTPPAEIAAAAAEVVELAVLASEHGKAAMHADASAAALLARAAADSAVAIVESNLKAVSGDGTVVTREALLQRARTAADDARVRHG